MKECRFLRKLCPGGCPDDVWVCRAFFPDKQLNVLKSQLSTCLSNGECITREDATRWREERRMSVVDVHCPYARNTVCGKPWLWLCKSGVTPYFPLTEAETNEKGLPVRDSEGKVVLKRGLDEYKDTCFSGKLEVYEGCPYYQYAEKQRNLKGLKTGEP